jgi:excisionase family DNA binding protein
MAAIGNLNEFVKYQMGKGFESGGGSAGAAGTAAELAVGFGIAQQMMQQGFAGGQATPTLGIPGAGQTPAASAAALPELLGQADAAQALGVSDADVLAILESGELKGKKIGSTWRITRSALREYLES